MKYTQFVHSSKIRIKKAVTRRRVAVASLIAATLIFVPAYATYAHFAGDIADREQLMNRDSTGIVIKDKHGETLYSHGQVARQELKLSEISDNLERAVVASEDQDFYKHEGYSARGIVRSVKSNILSKDSTRYGGSTITQQLVKNKLLGTEKNFYRKYQEVVMAIAVERRYSKQEIMEMYLNSAYFGEGAFGAQAAAKTYYNKSAQELSLAESTMLIGLLPAPSVLSPVSGDINQAKEHQQRVIGRMVQDGYIKQEETESIAGQKLVFAPPAKQYPHAPHFVMMVLDELKNEYGEENVARSGYEVTTTLDLGWQKKAEAQLREKIEQIKGQGATNASLVALDPKTGEIRTLVGSVDWENQQFGKVNMATTPRQPGSSFKPIFFSEALNRKIITAATVVKDEKKTFDDWKPTNYDLKYRGDVTIRNALAQSLNIPAIEVMQKLGPQAASETAQRMQIAGINDPQKYGLSLALGTAEAQVLDMTNAYAALANHGQQYKVSKITSIKNKFDQEIVPDKSNPQQVTTPEASFLVSSILADNNARAPIFGKSLNIDGRQVAVKTGTTNDSKDAWTIGYTPSLSVGVWVGNNQNQPMTGLVGSNSAGAIWRGTMISMLDKQATEQFTPTAAIVQKQTCEIAGLGLKSTGTLQEYFIKGTEPSDTCKKKFEPPKQEMQKRDDDEEKSQETPKPKQQKDEGGRGGGEAAALPAESSPTPAPAPQPTPPAPEPEPSPTEPPPSSTST